LIFKVLRRASTLSALRNFAMTVVLPYDYLNSLIAARTRPRFDADQPHHAAIFVIE
jgi:hypothetical protein